MKALDLSGFIKAGGALTLEEWRQLTVESRAELIAAKEAQFRDIFTVLCAIHESPGTVLNSLRSGKDKASILARVAAERAVNG